MARATTKQGKVKSSSGMKKSSNRGSRKRQREAEQDSTSKEESLEKKRVFVQKSKVWSFEERCRLVQALETEKCIKFPHTIVKFVGNSKKIGDIDEYRKYHRMVEQGKPFPEFKNRAPLDAWIELAEKSARLEDKRAEECIPQIMTVAALEKHSYLQKNQTESEQSPPAPNLANVYNFLSMLLRGGELPDLPPVDAQIVLNLLDGLVHNLANSFTMLQKEFLHQAFEVLNKLPDKASKTKKANDTIPEKNDRHFPSLNPLNVPQNLLEFKKKIPASLDLSVQWKTGRHIKLEINSSL